MTSERNDMTTKINSTDAALLLAEIREIREGWDGETTGLAATRRVDGDDREWLVSFSNDAAQFLTVISDDDMGKKTDDEIRDLILSEWDTDWDDVRSDRAVGDYQLGSADFEQRNAGGTATDDARADSQ